MINDYVTKKYINNSSDILSYSNDINFIKILNVLNDNKFIVINSHLIHKQNRINQIEQFIFNLDNYISFIKQNVFINQLELRYIINLTLFNKYNKALYCDKYYYENIEYYKKEFIKMFMFCYEKNYKILSKYVNIKKHNFIDLINIINNDKKRTYAYFENIKVSNVQYYIPIIESLEGIN